MNSKQALRYESDREKNNKLIEENMNQDIDENGDEATGDGKVIFDDDRKHGDI